eukprot:TRINITY_DN57848_c0_g2_i1.p1 TRINITY_DN57848_c0_g2~~TRINITY_DN57848_c0_g2_i1.p1  ORF type:complete len:355 (+),score=37.75 TRINITY_DN57848_c0_g2_i1:42-1106(+)
MGSSSSAGPKPPLNPNAKSLDDACLFKHTFNTAQLLATFPLRFSNRNKRLVLSLLPALDCVAHPTVHFSRWLSSDVPVPEKFPSGFSEFQDRISSQPGFFDYKPTQPELQTHHDWWPNFADSDLFGFWDSPLLAQDELQVLEHPILSCIKRALSSQSHTSEHARGFTTGYLRGGQSSPVLVMNVPRQCEINTVAGNLYGNNWSHASDHTVRQFTKVFQKEAVHDTHLYCIVAPSNGFWNYSQSTIDNTFLTAYTAFAAAKKQSDKAGKKVVIHAGYWGCGAFGGNPVVMSGLQLLAAHLVGVDKFVMHEAREGPLPFKQGIKLCAELVQDEASVSEVLRKLQARHYKWGISTGE